ncbi:MAG: hypothetical protein Fur0025_12580 [Oscillatoriaceae cyanobacterium]
MFNIDSIGDMACGLASGVNYEYFLHGVTLKATLLAQNVTDPDIMGKIGKSIQHFIKTGQAVAFIIGLALGFMLRGNIGK